MPYCMFLHHTVDLRHLVGGGIDVLGKHPLPGILEALAWLIGGEDLSCMCEHGGQLVGAQRVQSP